MNVSIRPLEVSDAKVSWRWRNDPIIWKFTGSQPNITITEEIELKWIKRVIKENDSARFAILVQEGASFVYIGNIQLTNIQDAKAQYHVFIGDTNYWGKGIAQRATMLILNYGFVVLKLQSIWLEVNGTHKSAIHLYKKCGFFIPECSTDGIITMIQSANE